MKLRYYQEEAVNALYAHARTRKDNPCIVIPTGGGKTPVIARICSDLVRQWNGRAIVVAHVKELLEQSHDKLRMTDPDLDVGLYSAGLGKREKEASVVVAGIQSVYKRAYEMGVFNIMIVDEAHMIPPDGEGMYRQFIQDALRVNPKMRVVGLTATPYRMTSGMICGPDNVLNHVCYEIGVRELISQGYLSPLTSKRAAECDTTSLHKRGGEFIADELDNLMDTNAVVNATCSDILARTRDQRRSCLIFCCSVKHAMHVTNVLSEAGVNAACVHGDTPSGEREQTLAKFKACDIQYLTNVNVLTTGFDAPNIDAVIMLRPTASPGLYYQMVGRGFRICEGKKNCMVLDYSGNVERLGPIDQIDVAEHVKNKSQGGESEANRGKTCMACGSVVALAYDVCPDCDEPFPPPPAKHDIRPADVDILNTPRTLRVDGVSYYHHKKRGDENATPCMCVSYDSGMETIREYVCIEHQGFARGKAKSWWQDRTEHPFPVLAFDAVDAGNKGYLREPAYITVTKDGKFDRIISCDFGVATKPFIDTGREPGIDIVHEDKDPIDDIPVYNWDEVPF